MPDKRIVRALEALRSDLAEVKATLGFAVIASSIRARLGTMIDWTMLDDDTKRLAQQFMNLRGSYAEGVFRGLYVSMAASYEQFVRDLVSAGVEVTASSIASFDDLSDNLKQQNIHLTGRALETVFGRRAHLKFDYYALSANIGTCVPGSKEFQLNTDAFSAEITTPNSEGLGRALERIGVAGYWDVIARHRNVQLSLGTAGVRETHKTARDFLDAFVSRRNVIVHAGRGTTAVLESDVAQALEFLDAFCEALSEAVSAAI